MTNEILEALEGMARTYCYTNLEKLSDSGCLSDVAYALRVLAKHNKFRIVREHGRMVAGYWPENDPLKPAKTP